MFTKTQEKMGKMNENMDFNKEMVKKKTDTGILELKDTVYKIKTLS